MSTKEFLCSVKCEVNERNIPLILFYESVSRSNKLIVLRNLLDLNRIRIRYREKKRITGNEKNGEFKLFFRSTKFLSF